MYNKIETRNHTAVSANRFLVILRFFSCNKNYRFAHAGQAVRVMLRWLNLFR